MPTLDQLLVFAARSGNAALAEERIVAGADVRYSDAQNGSALFQAIRCHHIQVVELLLSRGADIHQKDSRGNGPLEYALHAQDDEIVATLLAAGAQLQPHALPNFKRLLSECLERRAKKEPIQSTTAQRASRVADR